MKIIHLNNATLGVKIIKVSTGKSKGLNLISENNPDLRPTKDRVKEALFNILQFKIKGKNFLDLFGGTGQIGIEAFSRGAENVAIIDNNSNAIKLIHKNVAKISAPHQNIQVVKSDALDFINSTHMVFDIAFLDPPYANNSLLNRCLEEIPKIMSKNSIIITENLFGENIQFFSTLYPLKKTYKYGKMCLNLYETPES